MDLLDYRNVTFLILINLSCPQSDYISKDSTNSLRDIHFPKILPIFDIIDLLKNLPFLPNFIKKPYVISVAFLVCFYLSIKW